MPLHYTKSGNLDMRYSSSKAAVASSSGGGGGGYSYSSGTGGDGGGSGYSSGGGGYSGYGYSGSGSGSGGGSSDSSGLHYTKSGNLDMRYSSSKAAAAVESSGSAGGGGYSSGTSTYTSGGGSAATDLHYTKDGNLDMRYSSSKVAVAGHGGSSSSDLHYTKDGNLDMRYSSSKAAVGSGQGQGSASRDIDEKTIHLKKDGQPDMRYTSSRQLVDQMGKLRVSGVPAGIKVTKSGLPDMRTTAGKEWVRQQATLSTGKIPAWLPTKKDGTLDMSKKVVQEYINIKPGASSRGPTSLYEGNPHQFRDNYYKRKMEDTESEFRCYVELHRRGPVEIPQPYILPQTATLREQLKSASTRMPTEQSSAGALSFDLGRELRQEIAGKVPEIDYNLLKKTFGDELKATLGSGSFGVVLKGTWNGRPVAVKRLHLAQLTRKDKQSFVTEVKILALVGAHPNLVTLLGYSLDPPAIVMEFVELGSLSFLLHYCEDPAIEAQFTDGRIKKRLLLGIVSGMRQIHAVGVVHGDLKPANVLVAKDFTAKVTDFGLATLRGKTSSTVVSTVTTSTSGSEDNVQVAGTGAYMGPELLDSSERPNFSSDVYSFGILLNEVVQEEEPYSGEEANFHGRGAFGAANYARLGNRPYIKDKTPAGVRKLIQDCWNSQLKLRPSFETISNTLAMLQIPDSF